VNAPHQDDDGVPEFSRTLRDEVKWALGLYLKSDGELGRSELKEATTRVCREARAMGMPAEQMVKAAKQLFAHCELRLPDGTPERRRYAFEAYLTDCITAFFEPMKPE
jgi:hypothetical protein